MKIKRYGNIINQGIIITWTPEGKGSSRAYMISRKLSLPIKRFYMFTRKKLFSPFKFPFLFFKTFLFLLKKKPFFIIADVTQPFILIPIYIYSLIKKVPFFCDLHSGPLVAPHLRPFRKILFFLIKKAEFVILHENTIKELFNYRNIKTVTLHDPLPDFRNLEYKKEHNEEKYIVYISVGAPDEPLIPVIEAFKKIEINLYITGQWKINILDLPENIKFTGFLERRKFEELLLGSYAVMAFTKWEYTMLGAAYEALSISKPLITSKTKALQKFFDDAVIFVEHKPESIIEGVNLLIKNYYEYLQKIKKKRIDYIEKFNREFQTFKNELFLTLKKHYYKY